MTLPAIVLRPMSDDEYVRYARERDQDYIASLSVSLPRAAAEAKAREDRERFLPAGARTPGHLLLWAEAAADEAVRGDPGVVVGGAAAGSLVVGAVWLGLSEPRTGTADTAWLYDLWVDPEHRRQGYARAVLRAVEQRAREAGARRLGLNVFGEKAAARSLYESAGYDVTTQQMAKALA